MARSIQQTMFGMKGAVIISTLMCLVLVLSYIALPQAVLMTKGCRTPAQPPAQQEARCNCSKHVNLYDMTSPVQPGISCITLHHVKPPTPICMYGKHDYLSRTFMTKGIYEEESLKLIQRALREDPTLGFLDFGAYLGYYSLIAANMGHQVVAVEPVASNVWRLHKAAVLAGTTNRITVIQNGLSDRREVVPLDIISKNVGGSSMMTSSGCTGRACVSVQNILVDDLLPRINFTKAIMKVDIQGYEPKAFSSAEKLFMAVFIPMIHMEMVLFKENCHGPKTKEAKLVQDMITFFKKHSYEAYDTTGTRKLGKDCSSWPYNGVWIRKESSTKTTAGI